MRRLVKVLLTIFNLSLISVLSESVKNGLNDYKVHAIDLSNSASVNHSSSNLQQLNARRSTNESVQRRSDKLFFNPPNAASNLPPSIINYSHYFHPFLPGIWKLPSEIYQRVIRLDPQTLGPPQPALVESRSFITNPEISSIRMNYVISDKNKLIMPVTKIEKRQHLPPGQNIFYGIESRNPQSEEISTESDFGKFLNDDYRSEIEKQAEALVKNKFKNTKSTKVLEPVTSKEHEKNAPEPLQNEPVYDEKYEPFDGGRYNKHNGNKNQQSDYSSKLYGYDSHHNGGSKELNQNYYNSYGSYEQLNHNDFNTGHEHGQQFENNEYNNIHGISNEQPHRDTYNSNAPELGQQYENNGYNNFQSLEIGNQLTGGDHYNPSYNHFDSKYGPYTFSGESYSPHDPGSYEEYRARYFNLPNYLLLSNEDTKYDSREHFNQPRFSNYFYNRDYKKSKHPYRKRFCSDKPETSSRGIESVLRNPLPNYPDPNYHSNLSSQEKMRLQPEKIHNEYRQPETKYNSHEHQRDLKSVTYEHLLSSFENTKPRNSYFHEIQKLSPNPANHYSNEINDINAYQSKARVVTSSPIMVQARIPDMRTKTNNTILKKKSNHKNTKRKHRRSPKKRHKQKRSSRGKEDLRVAATTNLEDEESEENDKNDFYMYKTVPNNQFFEMGYRLGGPDQTQERYHISDGVHSKIRLNWKDKNGDKGEQYWEFNHDSSEGNEEN